MLFSALILTSTVAGAILSQNDHLTAGRDANVRFDLYSSRHLKPSYHNNREQSNGNSIDRLESKILKGSQSAVTSRAESQANEPNPETAATDNDGEFYPLISARSSGKQSSSKQSSGKHSGAGLQGDAEIEYYYTVAQKADQTVSIAGKVFKEAKSPRSKRAARTHLDRCFNHCEDLRRYASQRAMDAENLQQIGKRTNARQFVRQYQRLQTQRAKEYDRIMKQHELLQNWQAKASQSKKTEGPEIEQTPKAPPGFKMQHNMDHHNMGQTSLTEPPGGGWKSLRTIQRKQAGGGQQRLSDREGSASPGRRGQLLKNSGGHGGKSAGQSPTSPKSDSKQQ